MAVDWSIDSGWEILTIVSLGFGIILAIFKIFEVVRKKRYDEKMEELRIKEIESKIPKDAKIQFIKIAFKPQKRRYFSYSFDFIINLQFIVRNMGDFDTIVTLHKIEFYVLKTVGWSYNYFDEIKSIKGTKVFELAPKDKVTYTLENCKLEKYNIKKYYLRIDYSYINKDGKEVRRKTGYLHP